MMRWNPFARIFHSNPIALATIVLDRYRASLAIEFNRVVDQVGKHLHQPVGIGEHPGIRIDKII